MQWLAFLGMVALLAALLVPNFIRARTQGNFTCRGNLKNLGTALEVYASDHQRRYPADLKALLPGYLRALPTCPIAGAATYEARVPPTRKGYLIWCAGRHHEAVGAPPGFPQYSSTSGLIERPRQLPD